MDVEKLVKETKACRDAARKGAKIYKGMGNHSLAARLEKSAAYWDAEYQRWLKRLTEHS